MSSLYANVDIWLAHQKDAPLSECLVYPCQSIMVEGSKGGGKLGKSKEPIQVTWLNASLEQLRGATYVRIYSNRAILMAGTIETGIYCARCINMVTTMYVRASKVAFGDGDIFG